MRDDPVTNAEAILQCLTREWSSVDDLALRCGLSRNAAGRHLTELHRLGKLERCLAPSQRGKAYLYRRKAPKSSSGQIAGKPYYRGLIDW